MGDVPTRPRERRGPCVWRWGGGASRLEPIVGEDAAQVGVVIEEDAEHVPHLALEPVGGGELGYDGGDALVALVPRDERLHADPGVVLMGDQLVHHLRQRGRAA